MIAPARAATAARLGGVSETDAAAFHGVRPRLFGIAYRTLGSVSDADDVVQETWIRWQKADRGQVRDPKKFLATSTHRLAINVAQSARVRHETTTISWLPERPDTDVDPAFDAEQGEALELAIGMLLEKLSATERAVYLLREAFDYPYKEIAELFNLREPNVRQLASRARTRLSAGERRVSVSAHSRQRHVDAFLAAARTGDLARLEQLLIDNVDQRPAIRLATWPMRAASRRGKLAA